MKTRAVARDSERPFGSSLAPLAIALAFALIGSGDASAQIGDLFAVTDNDEVAEQLSFGPGALTPASSAFLSTDFKDSRIEELEQVLRELGLLR